MSFQTSVFEDGRWVTRRVDPYHLRTRNAQREGEKIPPLRLMPEEAPSYGCLTWTLVEDSVLKTIVPARIRHKTKNDVLFVHANTLTVKEAFGDYSLKNVIVEQTFDSPIRSLRVLGYPRETEKGDKYNRVMRTCWTPIWPTEDYETYHVDSEPSRALELPPQIAVLALESKKLVFFCSLNGHSDQPSFTWSQHPLPAATWPNEQIGEQLAVDPK